LDSTFPNDSVGLVTPRTVHLDEPLSLERGGTLPAHDLVYETYGELNEDASNAVLVCHALSSNHHAAGYHCAQDRKPGWWDVMIGPGKPIDTTRFHVVCCNNIGGCFGSTGPSSTDPATGRRYGPDFPAVTVKDWVASQRMLADQLGIRRWRAVVGGSLGGMQALQWAIDYPDRVSHAVAIAAAPKLSAQNIAFNEVARQAIRSDPDFRDGRYQDHGVVPRRGLRLARMLGHITYLSDESMAMKFGRDLREQVDDPAAPLFQVESYLRHQGDTFAEVFDANTYLLITKVLDYFDPAEATGGDLSEAFRGIRAHFFLVSFSSDWRFPPLRSREIVKALHDNDLNVCYAEVTSQQGHDTFLLPIPQYMTVFKAYMDRAASMPWPG